MNHQRRSSLGSSYFHHLEIITLQQLPCVKESGHCQDLPQINCECDSRLIHFIYTVLTLKYGVKLAKCVCIMRIASKCTRDFDCDWERVNAFSHCVTLIRVLLSQIISYSDTKVPVLVIMECKRANVINVYELIFLLHTSRSTECMSSSC